MLDYFYLDTGAAEINLSSVLSVPEHTAVVAVPQHRIVAVSVCKDWKEYLPFIGEINSQIV